LQHAATCSHTSSLLAQLQLLVRLLLVMGSRIALITLQQLVAGVLTWPWAGMGMAKGKTEVMVYMTQHLQDTPHRHVLQRLHPQRCGIEWLLLLLWCQ
jgi:hypothetical protein